MCTLQSKSTHNAEERGENEHNAEERGQREHVMFCCNCKNNKACIEFFGACIARAALRNVRSSQIKWKYSRGAQQTNTNKKACIDFSERQKDLPASQERYCKSCAKNREQEHNKREHQDSVRNLQTLHCKTCHCCLHELDRLTPNQIRDGKKNKQGVFCKGCFLTHQESVRKLPTLHWNTCNCCFQELDHLTPSQISNGKRKKQQMFCKDCFLASAPKTKK